MGGLWGLLTWLCSPTLPRTSCVASGDLLTFLLQFLLLDNGDGNGTYMPAECCED